MIGLLLQATGALVWGAIIWEGVTVLKPKVLDVHNQFQQKVGNAPAPTENTVCKAPEDTGDQEGA